MIESSSLTPATAAHRTETSVTLFCARTDFTEAGELHLLVTEDQLGFLTDVMRAQGYLDSRRMVGAFQMLLSNQLVWSRAIKSGLLGELEQPNDLMSRNAAGTRMPARVHAEYLRRRLLENDLAEGNFSLLVVRYRSATPTCAVVVVGTETDHIAPWRSVFRIHLPNEGDVTLVLTPGAVSEPGRPRRHFRTHRRRSGEHFEGPRAWFAETSGQHVTEH